MSVRSDEFNNLIALIVVNDKQGVIDFLRSVGVEITNTASNDVIIEALYVGLRDKTFSSQFATWMDTRYDDTSNASGFDPISAQDGANLKNDSFAEANGGNFNPMSAQDGVNLKDDGFANASGTFDTTNTQSGDFNPMETQYANIDTPRPKVQPLDLSGLSKGVDLSGSYLSNNRRKPGGTKFGNFLRGINWKDVFNTGVGIYQTKQEIDALKELNKAQNGANNAANNPVNTGGGVVYVPTTQPQAQKSNTVLYIVGGVVLLAGIGTAIYFATKK